MSDIKAGDTADRPASLLGECVFYTSKIIEAALEHDEETLAAYAQKMKTRLIMNTKYELAAMIRDSLEKRKGSTVASVKRS